MGFGVLIAARTHLHPFFAQLGVMYPALFPRVPCRSAAVCPLGDFSLPASGLPYLRFEPRRCFRFALCISAVWVFDVLLLEEVVWLRPLCMGL
jgi:hypothetical protein